MKFEEMPYKRVDLEEVKQEFTQLMQEFDAAASGEEQFEVQKKYYRFSIKIINYSRKCSIFAISIPAGKDMPACRIN